MQQHNIAPSEPLSYCALDSGEIAGGPLQAVYYSPRPGVVLAFCGDIHRKQYQDGRDRWDQDFDVRRPAWQAPQDGEAVSPSMMDELRQDAMREDVKRSQLAIQLCEGLGLGEPLRENPAEMVVYHAQATMFIRALELMIRRGMAKGHSFQRTGWAGALLDIHKKALRLMHVGWDTYQPGDMLYIPNEYGMISDEEGPWGDAVDLLNHTGFFMQCLQANNRLGR